MKTRINNGTIVTAAVMAVLVGVSCGRPPQEVRKQAGIVLHCPEDRIEFAPGDRSPLSGPRRFDVSGCGRKVAFVYVQAFNCSDYRDTTVHSGEGWVTEDAAQNPCSALGFNALEPKSSLLPAIPTPTPTRGP